MYQNQNMNQGMNTSAQNGQNMQGQQGAQSGSNNSNRVVVPDAKGALNNMKYEIARELGVNLKQGYHGDLTSREAGYVGGYMVKRLIESAEKQMAGQQNL